MKYRKGDDKVFLISNFYILIRVWNLPCILKKNYMNPKINSKKKEKE